MRPISALLLVVLAALAVGAAWQYGIGPATEATTEAGPPPLAFPDLTGQLQSAARVEIDHQGKAIVVARSDKGWGLADRNGFPVEAGKLHTLLTGLTELRLLEPRTSDPKQYARLGVDDPKIPQAVGTLMTVADAAGKPLAALIVGHTGPGRQDTQSATLYVRKPDEAQAWLAQGKLDLPGEALDWVDRTILAIPEKRIASVRITRGEEKLDLAREGNGLVLKAPTDHPTLDDTKLASVADALDTLTLTDEREADKMPGTALGTSVFTTSDGLRLTFTVNKAGNDLWAVIAASGDGGAKTEADKIAARVGGWAYQLGNWTEKSIVPSLADLAAPKPAAPQSSPVSSPASGPVNTPSPAPAPAP